MAYILNTEPTAVRHTNFCTTPSSSLSFNDNNGDFFLLSGNNWITDGEGIGQEPIVTTYHQEINNNNNNNSNSKGVILKDDNNCYNNDNHFVNNNNKEQKLLR